MRVHADPDFTVFLRPVSLLAFLPSSSGARDLGATLGLSKGPSLYLSPNPTHHGFLQLILILVTRKLFTRPCVPLDFRMNP